MPSAQRQSTIVGPVRSPEGSLAFPHLLVPETTGQYPSNKFITTFLIKEDAVITELVAACVKCAQLEWPTLGIQSHQGLKMPFRKGSEKPGWEGYLFIKAKSKNKPPIIDARKQAFSGAIRGGDICKLAVSAMPYKMQLDPEVAAALAARGVLVQQGRDDQGRNISWRPAVTFLLNAVQWLRAGPPIGGGSVDGTTAFAEEAPAAGAAPSLVDDLFG